MQAYNETVIKHFALDYAKRDYVQIFVKMVNPLCKFNKLTQINIVFALQTDLSYLAYYASNFAYYAKLLKEIENSDIYKFSQSVDGIELYNSVN